MLSAILVDLLFGLGFVFLVGNEPEMYPVALIVALLLLTIRLLGSHFQPLFWLLALPTLLLWPEEQRWVLLFLTLAYFVVHGLLAYERKVNQDLADRLTYTEQMNSLYLQKMDEHRRLEEEMQYTTRLEERNELSQKIHDLVGHSLSGALLQLELADRLLDRDAAQTRELLTSATGIIREGTEEIRQVLRETQPETRELGVQRLRQILDEYTKRTGIETSLLTSGSMDRITPIHWNALIGNLREALTNTSKHSRASHVACRLDVFAQRIRLTIEDDGVGAENFRKGMGFRGMEDRAANLGGHVLTDGSNGMRITTLLPLALAKAEPEEQTEEGESYD